MPPPPPTPPSPLFATLQGTRTDGGEAVLYARVCLLMVLVLSNERYRIFHNIGPDMFAGVPPELQRLLSPVVSFLLP